MILFDLITDFNHILIHFYIGLSLTSVQNYLIELTLRALFFLITLFSTNSQINLI